MASLNPESDISSFVNTIFEAAILVARDQNVMTGLVRGFNDRTGLAVRQNSQYGGATMNTVAETDDLVGQSFTPASIATLTPTEAAAQYFLTDSRIESDPFNVQRDAAQDLGEATATKIETDLVGVFSGFTGGTVGGVTSTISWNSIMNAQSILKTRKAPAPYFCVLHPYQWAILGAAASVASTVRTNIPEALMGKVNDTFFVGQAYGVSIFVSSNISIASNAAHAGMFSRDAIGFDLRRAPRLEPERDASRRGWELNMSTVYAAAKWRPLFGVDMYYLATAGTA